MKRRTLIKFAGLIPCYTFFNTVPSLASFAAPKIGAKKPKPLFDSLIGNNDSKLVVIAGRPSMGKTAVLINLLDEVSEFKQNKSFFFSIELSKEKALQRWHALQSGVSFQSLNALYRSQMSAAKGFISYSEELSEVDDSGSLSVQELRKRVELYKSHHSSLKYVFVDYIQLLSNEQKFTRRQLVVEDILKSLKKMAADLNLVVIAACQLNRGMESRSDKRPLPKDLREIRDFSAIDKLVLIYRKKYYDENAENLIRFTTFENQKHLRHGLFNSANVCIAKFNSEHFQITEIKS